MFSIKSSWTSIRNPLCPNDWNKFVWQLSILLKISFSGGNYLEASASLMLRLNLRILPCLFIISAIVLKTMTMSLFGVNWLFGFCFILVISFCMDVCSLHNSFYFYFYLLTIFWSRVLQRLVTLFPSLGCIVMVIL